MDHLRKSIFILGFLFLNSCGYGYRTQVPSTTTLMPITVAGEYPTITQSLSQEISVVPTPARSSTPATISGDSEIYNILVSPNGEMLVLTDSTGIRVYGLAAGKVLYNREIEVPDQYQGQGDFSYIAWSPDGTSLAVGKPNLGVCIWDVATWKLLTERDSKRMPTYERPGFVWSPDGKQLALGIGEGEIVIWDKQSNKWATKTNYTGLQVSLTWVLDGRLMVMNNEGLYDVETGSFVRGLNLVMDGGYAYALWSSDQKHMYAFYDLGGSILDIESNEYEFSTCCYSEVAWSMDGRYFAATPEDSNEISVWDTQSDKLVMQEKQGDIIYAFAWTPSGELLAVGLNNEQIVLWDTKTRDNLFKINP